MMETPFVCLWNRLDSSEMVSILYRKVSNSYMTDIELLSAAIGLTFILKYGFILNVPRNWLKGKSVYLKELLSCSQCLGFWSGLGVYFLAGFMTAGFSLSLCLFSVFFGFLNSFVANVTDMLVDIVDEKLFLMRGLTEHSYNDDDKAKEND